jgi:nucleoside-diphosphate-sugar epimerase
MAAASDRVVTVFGGTGFLGRRIVRHLRLHDFCVRVASRHPDSGHALLPLDDPQVRSIKADVHDERSVADALADAYGAVNAVSLYVEQGRETFHSVHVESAQRVAAQAQRAGVKRLIHVSGIGANPRSQSPYIRKRGEGELAVRAAFGEMALPCTASARTCDRPGPPHAPRRDAEQANGSLRQELVRLRRTIGEEVLPGAGTTSQPVRLDVTDVDIDVVRFRGAAAAPGGGAEAIALYSTSRDGR